MAYSPSSVVIPYHTETIDLSNLATWRPPDSVINVLGLLGVICCIYLAAMWLNKPKQASALGEDAMVRHFRNQQINFMIGEGITNFVEDLVFTGKLSRSDAMDIYYKFGHAFGIEGLIQLKPPKAKLTKGQSEYLKHQIKERIKSQTVDKVVAIKPALGRKFKAAS